MNYFLLQGKLFVGSFVRIVSLLLVIKQLLWVVEKIPFNFKFMTKNLLIKKSVEFCGVNASSWLDVILNALPLWTLKCQNYGHLIKMNWSPIQKLCHLTLEKCSVKHFPILVTELLIFVRIHSLQRAVTIISYKFASDKSVWNFLRKTFGIWNFT